MGAPPSSSGAVQFSWTDRALTPLASGRPGLPGFSVGEEHRVFRDKEDKECLLCQRELDSKFLYSIHIHDKTLMVYNKKES